MVRGTPTQRPFLNAPGNPAALRQNCAHTSCAVRHSKVVIRHCPAPHDAFDRCIYAFGNCLKILKEVTEPLH
jgi:hypothetical protein